MSPKTNKWYYEMIKRASGLITLPRGLVYTRPSTTSLSYSPRYSFLFRKVLNTCFSTHHITIHFLVVFFLGGLLLLFLLSIIHFLLNDFWWSVHFKKSVHSSIASLTLPSPLPLCTAQEFRSKMAEITIHSLSKLLGLIFIWMTLSTLLCNSPLNTSL